MDTVARAGWRSWPALLGAPLVALGQQSLTYALVTPSCQRQTTLLLHLVAAVSLFVAVACTMLAARALAPRLDAEVVDTDSLDDLALEAQAISPDRVSGRRARFIAGVAVAMGGLSSLVCAAMWLPVFILSPCHA